MKKGKQRTIEPEDFVRVRTLHSVYFNMTGMVESVGTGMAKVFFTRSELLKSRDTRCVDYTRGPISFELSELEVV